MPQGWWNGSSFISQAEYVLEEAYAAYPEKHSVWDKIKVPTGTMTLEAHDEMSKTDKKVRSSWVTCRPALEPHGWNQQPTTMIDEAGKMMHCQGFKDWLAKEHKLKQQSKSACIPCARAASS